MFKDTKSLGNNKASAWESRGFVIKKEGMHFDTPSFLYNFQLFTQVYERIIISSHHSVQVHFLYLSQSPLVGMGTNPSQ